MADWRERVQKELEQGEIARQQGNQGRARVCARRAASWAAKEFLARKGIEFDRASGYAYLAYLRGSDLVGDDIKTVAEHMTMSLAKDSPEEESYWPLEADLLEEARWLFEKLLGQA